MRERFIRIETESRQLAIERHLQTTNALYEERSRLARALLNSRTQSERAAASVAFDVNTTRINKEHAGPLTAERTLVVFNKRFSLPPKKIT